MKLLDWIRKGATDSDSKAKAVQEVGPILQKAYALLKQRDYEAAREVLLPLLEFRDRIIDRPTIDWVLTSLASTWLFQERFEELIAFLSDYIRSHPSDCAAYFERAAGYWYAGHLQEAVHDYSRAIELDPADLQSRSGRGQVLAELGESDKAIEDLDIALRIVKSARHPDDSWREWNKDMQAFIRNGRAVALADLGRVQEAMAEFDASISASPENAWVYYNRARVHERHGDREKALADYRTALSKDHPPLAPRQREVARVFVGD